MDVEEICSGWLTKSPSSKYVTLFSRGKISIRVPLKSKWHRRYFVLHKPNGSLPHQYAFDYFKDENDGRRRGTINLEECETILSELDSSHYPHLFSIKTKARDKDRVYYLAAETESDMAKWVKCLCSLCDLKMGPSDVTSLENHTVAPNPPVRHDSMQLTVDLPAQKSLSNQCLVDEELSNQILQEIEAIEQGQLDIDSRPANDRVPMGYTELAECSTGEAFRPETSAQFIELYDVPKSHRLTPPTRSGLSQSVRRVSKPGTQLIASSRSANSSPRFTRTLPAAARLTNGDPTAPPRPPKPGQAAEELYQNISSNSPLLVRSAQASPAPSRVDNNHTTNYLLPTSPLSANNSVHNSPAVMRKAENHDGHVSPARNFSVDSLYHNTMSLSPPPDGANSNTTAQSKKKDMESMYDVPKSCNISVAIPPPPTSCSNSTQQTIIHKYVNASAGIISRPPNHSSQNSREEDQSSEQPEFSIGEVIELARQSVDENHYHVGQVSSVDDKPTRPPKPRILSDPTTLDAADDDTFTSGYGQVLKVSKSFRTRAFTKDSVFSDSDESTHTYSREEIKLPSRINTNDSSSSSNESGSSSEREEDDQSGGTQRESIYSVPPTPRPLQPVLPERLHNKGLSLNHTPIREDGTGALDNQPKVMRSTSMPKVPIPHGNSMSKLSTVGAASPKLKNNQHHNLRSERSSSVSATDWRNRSHNIGSSLSQIMPLKHPLRAQMAAVNDIQYVELDQSEDRPELSPNPSRATLSGKIPAGGCNSKVSDLEYTDIDLIKTQALTVTRQERDRNLRKRSENMEQDIK